MGLFSDIFNYKPKNLQQQTPTYYYPPATAYVPPQPQPQPQPHYQPTNNSMPPVPREDEHINTAGWYISISFGKSTSANYAKALFLAKSAPQYHEQEDNGVILHQAIYSSNPNEFIEYLMLYEVVGNWKSSFVTINGKLIDRKIIGKLNYCYGDKCRIGRPDFCNGASYMTDNPFGCHRLQISACNSPWWSFYQRYGDVYILNRAAMKEQIDSYARIYYICPCFDYDNIIRKLYSLPERLTYQQYISSFGR